MKNIKKKNSRKIGIGPMSSEVIEAVYKYSSINNKFYEQIPAYKKNLLKIQALTLLSLTL